MNLLPENPIAYTGFTKWFKKGYVDATDEDEIFQEVGVVWWLDGFASIVDRRLVVYESDLPDISNCQSFEDVVIEFELKGWKLM
jgi:hypothetical protein